MIYFDNGATTLQKPLAVRKAIQTALLEYANPGRSGHQPAMKAAQAVYECRIAACQMFSVSSPENIVFTLNATHALNIAIKNQLHDGGHAVVSGYEHNSVVRPLEAMKDRGVSYTVAYSPIFDQEGALRAIEQAIQEDTKCVIVNYVSNVFGFVLPIYEIDDLCSEKGLPLIIDASQAAGCESINAESFKSVCFICMPGHKGLYGPQGTGLLINCKENQLYSLMEGGTGSNSIELAQPDFLPDIFEAGTLNVPGISGLCEGIKYVQMIGCGNILKHERQLAEHFAHGLSQMEHINCFYYAHCQNGVVSFTSNLFDPDTLCAKLAEKDICMRSGLHCSPLAHRSAGTLPEGTVRASFSYFNTFKEIDRALEVIGKITAKK